MIALGKLLWVEAGEEPGGVLGEVAHIGHAFGVVEDVARVFANYFHSVIG